MIHITQGVVSVTKKFTFCYGHHLPNYNGRCADNHGHNSNVEVEFVSIPGRDVHPGMTIDFREIKEHVGPIVDDLDHKDLNEVLTLNGEFVEQPTAENIARHLVERIQKETPIGLGLIRCRVSETDDSFAEWKV